MNHHAPVEQAIQTGFGFSSADFDKALQQYLSGNRFRYYKVPLPADIQASAYTSAPLVQPDVKAVMADVHMHSSDYIEQATQEFQEVLKLQPDNSSALRGLGYAFLRKRDYQNAGKYFAKAAEQDSHDPRVLYYSALLAQQEDGPQLKNDPERVATVQKQIEKSIALDPEFADAYSVLSFVLMAAGKTDQAIPVLLKAVSLNPRNEMYSMNLAQLYLVDHKYDNAIALYEQLSASSQPQIAAQATSMLSTARSMKEYSSKGGLNIRAESGFQSEQGTPVSSGPSVSAPPRNITPARFLKGKLLSVDCSAPPSAILTVSSGTKTWKLSTKDSSHMILIGADNFSCQWTNQKVSVNYRDTGENSGDIISLELQ
jgi:tetratricopeptide (TPR) repeat protein